MPLICGTVDESVFSGPVPPQLKEAFVTPAPPVFFVFFLIIVALRIYINTDLCETRNSSLNCARRLCYVSFATIRWPAMYVITSSLLNVRTTVRRQLSWVSWTAFLVVLMKARPSFWLYLSASCVRYVGSHNSPRTFTWHFSRIFQGSPMVFTIRLTEFRL